MHSLPALLLAALFAAPLAAAPARPAAAPAVRPAAVDWTARVTATPQGGLLIGNPNAPVKLVEFGSLTCPHCRHFHEEGLPALKSRWVASGQLSYEYRSFSLNGIDLMAGLLLQCQSPAAALVFLNRVYARQDELVLPFTQISEAQRAEIAALPADQFGPRMAELGKLPQFAAAAGIARARYDACLADKAGQDRLLAIRADAVQTHKLAGTPSFLINGRMQADVFDWAALEPLLAAAIKAAPAPLKIAPPKTDPRQRTK